MVRNDDEMMMLDEVLDVQREDVYLVDAGLSFNSPFPAVLRLPRGVNLILSFDFSLRSTENGNPFEVELCNSLLTGSFSMLIFTLALVAFKDF